MAHCTGIEEIFESKHLFPSSDYPLEDLSNACISISYEKEITYESIKMYKCRSSLGNIQLILISRHLNTARYNHLGF